MSKLFEDIIKLSDNGCPILNANDVAQATNEAFDVARRAIEGGTVFVPIKFLFLTSAGASLTFTPGPILSDKRFIGGMISTIMAGRQDITAMIHLAEASAISTEDPNQKREIERLLAEGKEVKDMRFSRNVLMASGMCACDNKVFSFIRLVEIIGTGSDRRLGNPFPTNGSWCNEREGLLVPSARFFLPMQGEMPKVGAIVNSGVLSNDRGGAYTAMVETPNPTQAPDSKPHTAKEWRT